MSWPVTLVSRVSEVCYTMLDKGWYEHNYAISLEFDLGGFLISIYSMPIHFRYYSLLQQQKCRTKDKFCCHWRWWAGQMQICWLLSQQQAAATPTTLWSDYHAASQKWKSWVKQRQSTVSTRPLGTGTFHRKYPSRPITPILMLMWQLIWRNVSISFDFFVQFLINEVWTVFDQSL